MMEATGTFRYKGMQSMWFVLFGTFAFEAILMLIGIFIFREEGFSTLFFALPVGGGVFFALVGVIAFLSRSDFSVDCNGVAWSLYGKVWRQISWENISVIRVTPTFAYGRVQPIVMYTIMPKSKAGGMPRRGGSGFDDQIGELHALMHLMNEYVSLHKIPIEISKDGQWRRATMLPDNADSS